MFHYTFTFRNMECMVSSLEGCSSEQLQEISNHLGGMSLQDIKDLMQNCWINEYIHSNKMCVQNIVAVSHENNVFFISRQF